MRFFLILDSYQNFIKRFFKSRSRLFKFSKASRSWQLSIEIVMRVSFPNGSNSGNWTSPLSRLSFPSGQTQLRAEIDRDPSTSSQRKWWWRERSADANGADWIVKAVNFRNVVWIEIRHVNFVRDGINSNTRGAGTCRHGRRRVIWAVDYHNVAATIGNIDSIHHRIDRDTQWISFDSDGLRRVVVAINNGDIIAVLIYNINLVGNGVYRRITGTITVVTVPVVLFLPSITLTLLTPELLKLVTFTLLVTGLTATNQGCIPVRTSPMLDPHSRHFCQSEKASTPPEAWQRRKQLLNEVESDE